MRPLEDAAGGKTRDFEAAAFIADNARIYGDVSIGEGSSVWFNSVIRAEYQDVTIGRYSNIQDFAMLHIGFNDPVRIGDFCSITHHATIHGATIGDACLIGIGATIMDGAVIGAGSIVGGGAVVPEGKVFPPHSIILGAPAKLKRESDGARPNRLNAWLYHRNALAYARGDHRGWDGPEHVAWLAEKKREIAEDRDLDL